MAIDINNHSSTISPEIFKTSVSNYESNEYYGSSWQAVIDALNNAGASISDFLNFGDLQANFNYGGGFNQASTLNTGLTTSKVLTGVNLAKAQLNSNTATKSTVSLAKNVGKATTAAGGAITMESVGSFFLGTLPMAIAAVGSGCELGVEIDGFVYNVMDALNLNPPHYLNPEWWGKVTKDDDSLGMQVFNAIFHVDTANGEVQPYITDESYASLAYWMNNQNWFTSGSATETTIPTNIKNLIDPQDIIWNPVYFFPTITLEHADHTLTRTYATDSDIGLYITQLSNNDVSPYIPLPDTAPIRVNAIATHPFNVYISDNGGPITTRSATNPETFTDPVTGTTVTYYKMLQIEPTPRQVGVMSTNYRNNKKSSNADRECFLAWKHGNNHEQGDRPDGISTQPGATVPDTTGWTDPAAVLQSLYTQYPDLFNPQTRAISIPTLQPDGTIENVLWVPLGYGSPTIQTTENGDKNYTLTTYGEQGDTAISLDDTNTQMLNDLLRSILNQINSWDPYICKGDGFTEDKEEEDEEEEEKEAEEDKAALNTGTGQTPAIASQVCTPTKLFQVYNPTDAIVSDFGNWLWDSSVMGALRNLIENPLDAIISLHQIYISPASEGTRDILVGKLDSDILCPYVPVLNQIKDCGTVQCMELFGNVFDYAPYTAVSIYLPFVGIVPLNVSDVMRGFINVLYSVNVLTGAFIVSVSVKRDGAGGVIYEYSGNMAVEYPLSGASYVNLYSSMLGLAATAVSAGAGLAAGAATGAPTSSMVKNGISGVMSMGSQVSPGMIQYSRSGSISANPGALGCKKPYLIITRPQIAVSPFDDSFHGVPSNEIVTLSACTGYTVVNDVRLQLNGAYPQEIDECLEILKTGAIF